MDIYASGPIHFDSYTTYMKSIDSELKIGSTSVPQLKPGQVLVKVVCFGVTQDDVAIHEAKGNHAFLGIEFSGIVQMINSDDLPASQKFKKGDRVLGLSVVGGSMAEYIACDVNTIAHIPAGISYVQAASLPDMWFSALQIVKQDIDVQKRNRVVVFGAMSTRGQAVVQLCQLIGCRRVHCVVNSSAIVSEAKHHLQLHGALPDELVVHENNANLSFSIARYDPKGLEAVAYIDSYPQQIFPEMVRPGGSVAIVPHCYQSPCSSTPKKSLLSLAQYELFVLKGLKLVGCNARRRSPQNLKSDCEFLKNHILPKVLNKQLKVTIDKTFDWKQTDQAIRWVKEHPESLGKVVCIVDQNSY